MSAAQRRPAWTEERSDQGGQGMRRAAKRTGIAVSKLRVWCAAVVVAALTLTLAGGVPTVTERERGWVPPPPADAPRVPVRDTAARPAPPWRAEHAAVRGETRVTWPVAGTTRLVLPASTGEPVPVRPVSYTHLTLPTIYSV